LSGDPECFVAFVMDTELGDDDAPIVLLAWQTMSASRAPHISQVRDRPPLEQSGDGTAAVPVPGSVRPNPGSGAIGSKNLARHGKNNSNARIEATGFSPAAEPTAEEKLAMGDLCFSEGLMHVEFRNVNRPLPPPEFYRHATKEIFIFGPTLSGTFKDEDTLDILAEKVADGVHLCLLVFHPDEPCHSHFKQGVGTVRGEEGIIEKLKNPHSRLDTSKVQVRGVQVWPHYTGVMIDGEIGVPFRKRDSFPQSVLLRIQPAIPPDNEDSLHLAPIYQYRPARPTETTRAYIRGFRFYWQKVSETIFGNRDVGKTLITQRKTKPQRRRR
jgi:hypothetical protein